MVVVVGLPGKQAVIHRVAGDDAGRGRGCGGGGGRRGQVGVGDVVRASVEGQGGLGEGGMQGLRRGVGAPQAPKQCVIHGVQTQRAFHGGGGQLKGLKFLIQQQKQKITSTYPTLPFSQENQSQLGNGGPVVVRSIRLLGRRCRMNSQPRSGCSTASQMSGGTEKWSSRLEAPEVPRNCRTRGASRGDVINRV